MYVVVVFWEGKREYRSALRDALLMQARNSLEKEPRCKRFDVAADPLEPASFLLYEVYDDEASFKAHLETTHFAEFQILVDPWTTSKRVLTYDLIPNRANVIKTDFEGGHA